MTFKATDVMESIRTADVSNNTNKFNSGKLGCFFTYLVRLDLKDL